jgi:REP element-mobilizing transposase RayT
MADAHLQLEAARQALGLESPEAVEQYLASMKGKPAIYHCVSRVANREKLLGAAEKTKFIEFMREYERYCQVRVMTFCVMSNHFHVLVEIPEAPEDRGKSWSDEKFLEHISSRYHGKDYRQIAGKLAWWRKRGLDGEAEKLRDRHFARMWDLSWFLRLLKQRFAQWFNWYHARDG